MRTPTTSRALAAFAGTLILATAACSADAPTAVRQPTTLAASRAAADCENVSTTAEVYFTSPTTGTGTISGDLNGVISVVVGEGAPSGADGHGALHYSLAHTITTTDGSIFTQDEGAFGAIGAPTLYKANVRYTIVGGTGRYAGATGMLRSHGFVDFGAGRISLRIAGRVCA
jgi:hypothetical protein